MSYLMACNQITLNRRCEVQVAGLHTVQELEIPSWKQAWKYFQHDMTLLYDPRA